MVDAHDSKSCLVRGESSSLSSGTRIMSLEMPNNIEPEIPKDPLELLGINKGATSQEIEDAWKEKVKKYDTKAKVHI